MGILEADLACDIEMEISLSEFKLDGHVEIHLSMKENIMQLKIDLMNQALENITVKTSVFDSVYLQKKASNFITNRLKKAINYLRNKPIILQLKKK